MRKLDVLTQLKYFAVAKHSYNTYYNYKNFFHCDRYSDAKIYLQPGLEALKVAKH